MASLNEALGSTEPLGAGLVSASVGVDTSSRLPRISLAIHAEKTDRWSVVIAWALTLPADQT